MLFAQEGFILSPGGRGIFSDAQNVLSFVSEDVQLQLEKAMATHSSILAWKNPRTEETGRLHTAHRVAKSWTGLSATPAFLQTSSTPRDQTCVTCQRKKRIQDDSEATGKTVAMNWAP